MTKQESKKALREIIKLTTRARDIGRELTTTKNKLAKLEKEEAEIYGKLSAFSDPSKPDTTDTLEDEPTESSESPQQHPFFPPARGEKKKKIIHFLLQKTTTKRG